MQMQMQMIIQELQEENLPKFCLPSAIQIVVPSTFKQHAAGNFQLWMSVGNMSPMQNHTCWLHPSPPSHVAGHRLQVSYERETPGHLLDYCEVSMMSGISFRRQEVTSGSDSGLVCGLRAAERQRATGGGPTNPYRRRSRPPRRRISSTRAEPASSAASRPAKTLLSWTCTTLGAVSSVPLRTVVVGLGSGSCRVLSWLPVKQEVLPTNFSGVCERVVVVGFTCCKFSAISRFSDY